MQYGNRNHRDLGNHYLRHVDAMTAESLHEKSDIAAELAWRDKQITELRVALLEAMEWNLLDENSPDDMRHENEKMCGV